MTSSEVWDEETARRYDEDAAEMFAPEVLDPAVDFLADLAGEGPALELAVGTGRIAIPLAARGVPVTGIELSRPMVDQLRSKADEATVPVILGDMASTTIEGDFTLVYLVWNSISNLRTQEEQVACFRNAARHLRSGGRFVIELWVPQLRRLPPGQVGVPSEVGDDGHLVLDTYDVSTQRCTSHHYWHDADGSTRYSSGSFRYLWPSECDLMAQLAGLGLEARYAGLAPQPVHLRQREPRVGLAQALTQTHEDPAASQTAGPSVALLVQLFFVRAADLRAVFDAEATALTVAPSTSGSVPGCWRSASAVSGLDATSAPVVPTGVSIETSPAGKASAISSAISSASARCRAASPCSSSRVVAFGSVA